MAAYIFDAMVGLGQVSLGGLYDTLRPVVYILTGVMLVIMGFPFFLMVLARLEKQVIRQFEPCEEKDIPYQSAYTQAVNQSAEELGLIFCGWCRQIRGGFYQATATAWISPDRRTMLLVGGGKLLGMDYKRMYLYSSTIDGPVLLTSDQSGEADLSGLLDTETLWNATLGELYDFHQERLVPWEDELNFFDADSFLEDYEAIDQKRVRVLVNAGMAIYLGYSQSEWRYTWKGAFALRSRYLKSWDKEKMQAYRFGPEFKRPGEVEEKDD